MMDIVKENQAIQLHVGDKNGSQGESAREEAIIKVQSRATDVRKHFLSYRP